MGDGIVVGVVILVVLWLVSLGGLITYILFEGVMLVVVLGAFEF